MDENTSLINIGELSRPATVLIEKISDAVGGIFKVSYFGKPRILNMRNETGNTLDIGRVMFTRVGLELAPICGGKPVTGFFHYVVDRWKKEGYVTNDVHNVESANHSNHFPSSDKPEENS